MHESFHALTEEKRNKIIDAAMKVFSQNPYGKACTDDIAAMAEISKGLLFYHFRKKMRLSRQNQRLLPAKQLKTVSYIS